MRERKVSSPTMPLTVMEVPYIYVTIKGICGLCYLQIHQDQQQSIKERVSASPDSKAGDKL
ncbi:hypothetical protein BDW75DRAFT_202034 [Aspergillus navahoensis]